MPSPVLPDDFKALVSDATSSLCGQFINTLLKLPVKIAQFFEWFLADDGNFSEEVITSITALAWQPGDMKMIAGSVAEGWLTCNGQAVDREDFAALFAVIGTTWGNGDGINTFNVPDMRDKFPMGAGGTYAIGATGGNANKTLSIAEMPEHTHRPMESSGSESNPLVGNDDVINGFAGQSDFEEFVSQTHAEELLEKTGGGDEFSILNPYRAVLYVIKT